MLQPCDQDLLPEMCLGGLGWDLNQLEPIFMRPCLRILAPCDMEQFGVL